MTSEKLILLLSDFNQLESVDLTELEGLITQFPACQIFHFLKAKKLQLENDDTYISAFQTYSSFAPDKNLLYFNFSTASSNQISDSLQEIDPFFNDLVEIHKGVAKKSKLDRLIGNSKESKFENLDVVGYKSEFIPIQNNSFESKEKVEQSKKQNESGYQTEQSSTNDMSNKDNKSDKKSKGKKDKKKREKKADIIKGKKCKSEKSLKKQGKEIKSKKKTKPDALQEKIDQSLVRKPEIISSTLAKIMAKQGHIQEAINIYAALIVANPEKKDKFKKKMKKLKKQFE